MFLASSMDTIWQCNNLLLTPQVADRRHVMPAVTGMRICLSPQINGRCTTHLTLAAPNPSWNIYRVCLGSRYGPSTIVSATVSASITIFSLGCVCRCLYGPFLARAFLRFFFLKAALQFYWSRMICCFPETIRGTQVNLLWQLFYFLFFSFFFFWSFLLSKLWAVTDLL